MTKEQKGYRIAIALGILAAVSIIFFPSDINAKQRDENKQTSRTKQERLCDTLPREALIHSKIFKEVCDTIVQPSPDPSPEPTATPGLNHIVITEVYYDVNTAHGVETTNEWIELYNGTGETVDLSGWIVSDSVTQRIIPDATKLNNGQYALIMKDLSTLSYWSIPQNTLVVTLQNTIGNGLGNDGDAMYLKNSNGVVIDAVSYGTNIDVFDPSANDVIEGHSLVRSDATVDSDLASDWIDMEIPTPGQ